MLKVIFSCYLTLLSYCAYFSVCLSVSCCLQLSIYRCRATKKKTFLRLPLWTEFVLVYCRLWTAIKREESAKYPILFYGVPPTCTCALFTKIGHYSGTPVPMYRRLNNLLAGLVLVQYGEHIIESYSRNV